MDNLQYLLQYLDKLIQVLDKFGGDENRTRIEQVCNEIESILKIKTGK